MSSSRVLTRRRADTVGRLLDAAVEELQDGAWDDLTVRRVARRAGVAPATAYTYFDSREHLVTEVFWERLRALPHPEVDRDRPAAERVAAAMAGVGALVSSQPNLAAACTAAMLASDDQVARLRTRIGGEVGRRIAVALDDDASPEVVRALGLTFSGAMVQAGMGHLDYDALAGTMADVARLIFEDDTRATARDHTRATARDETRATARDEREHR